MSALRQQKRPVNNRPFYSDPKDLITSLEQRQEQQVLLVQQLQQQRLVQQQEQ